MLFPFLPPFIFMLLPPPPPQELLSKTQPTAVNLTIWHEYLHITLQLDGFSSLK
uniref:Uncharacterized protein n=1 Tax=Rhizophora mucronata TaxID=61149 RepID=A0A2P2NK07_RHIMU